MKNIISSEEIPLPSRLPLITIQAPNNVHRTGMIKLTNNLFLVEKNHCNNRNVKGITVNNIMTNVFSN